MNNERAFTRAMRAKLGLLFHFISMEDCLQPGVPDLWLTNRFGTFAIEAKMMKSPNDRIPWRKHQPEWHREFYSRGGTSLMIVWVQNPSGRTAYLMPIKNGTFNRIPLDSIAIPFVSDNDSKAWFWLGREITTMVAALPTSRQ